MAEKFTTLANIDKALMEITDAYRKTVLNAIADGIQEGAEIFIGEARKVSPYDVDNHSTPHYKDSWQIKPMKKAKYIRYVGNTKKVKAHSKDSAPTIPLINILEYSTRPATIKCRHVGTAINNSKDQIMNLLTSKIQKVGK